MAHNDDVRLQAVVRGYVQGVFFRDFTWSHATRLGLVGTARNLRDGRSVDVIAEGPRAALEELLSQLRQGPPGAHVQGVDVDWGTARSEFSSFRIG